MAATSTLTLDPHIFSQIGLDSGSLTILGAVVHRFTEAGPYRCVVVRGDANMATFELAVDPGCSASQVDIDLSRLVSDVPHPGAGGDFECGPAGSMALSRYVVGPQGYAVFHVTGGEGGFAVHAGFSKAGPQPKAFDSRQLKEGDVFAATLLRPGRYSMKNERSSASADIVVAYPTPEALHKKALAPVQVELKEAFKPNHVEIQPSQGISIHCKAEARIRIELTKPDDGPGGPRLPQRPGWRKPVMFSRTK